MKSIKNGGGRGQRGSAMVGLQARSYSRTTVVMQGTAVFFSTPVSYSARSFQPPRLLTPLPAFWCAYGFEIIDSDVDSGLIQPIPPIYPESCIHNSEICQPEKLGKPITTPHQAELLVLSRTSLDSLMQSLGWLSLCDNKELSTSIAALSYVLFCCLYTLLL